MISQYYARNDRRNLKRLVKLVAHVTFWPSLLIAGVFAIFATQLLGLFGGGFGEGRAPLIILLVGQTINAAAGSVSFILNMTGHERDAFRVYAVSAAINIVAVYVGIELGGIVGAAIASSVTVALWNIWLHALSVRYLGVYPSVVTFERFRKRRGEPDTRRDSDIEGDDPR
jgi:O-antigen/teichoic acid export membrane protein